VSDDSSNNDNKLPEERRILVIVPSSEFDRSTVHMISESCRAMAQIGYKLTVLEPVAKNAVAHQGDVDITRVDGYERRRVFGWPKQENGREPLDNDRASKMLLAQLQEIKPDLVDVQHCGSFGAGILKVASEAGYTVKLSLHDYWMFENSEFSEPSAAGEIGSVRLSETVGLINQYVDRVVVVSRALKKTALDAGVKREKISLTQASISQVDRLFQSTQKIKRPIDPCVFRFSYVGDVNKQSGLAELMSAIVDVKEQSEVQAVINVYGETIDDAYMQSLNSDEGYCGAVKVNFATQKIQLEDVFLNTDMLLISDCVDTGFSYLIEKAFASQVPVLANRIGSVTEQIIDEVNGRIFDLNDTNSVVSIFDDIMQNRESVYDFQCNIRFPRFWRDWVNAEYQRYTSLLNDDFNINLVAQVLDCTEGQIAAIESNNRLYQEWVDNHSMREADGQFMAERMGHKWTAFPVFSLVIPVRASDQVALSQTLASLESQLYQNWAVTIVSTEPAPGEIFNQSEVLRWFQVPSDSEIMPEINAYVKQSQWDWTLLVQPGTEFDPTCLFSFADYINVHPEWSLIYTDDDEIGAAGEYCNPKFKTDINLDYIRSYNYIGDLVAIRTYVLQSLDGYILSEGVEVHDLVLKVIDTCTENMVGHIAKILMHEPLREAPRVKQSLLDDRTKSVIEGHLERQNIRAEVSDGYLIGTHRVNYQHSEQPLVSIVIPNKDMMKYFRPCIESIFEKTIYQNFEILVVDNQSIADETFAYYDEIQATYPGKIRLLSYAQPFNFSAMNNMAVAEAAGEYIVCLNNDIQIIQGSWLERLLSHAQRPEVGIVGARLLTSDKRIQHAGVILGLDGIAGHAFSGQSIEDEGYMKRAQVDMNYSAVTAACLMVKKSIYDEVGGYDEVNFTVQYNDVDFNLKVREKGYKIVYTPYATAIHYGSVSQITYNEHKKVARDTQEKRVMLEKWLPELISDPAYNVNLSLSDTRCIFEPEFEVSWDTNFTDTHKVIGFPTNTGAITEHRMKAPFRNLNDVAKIDYAYMPTFDMKPEFRLPTLTEFERWKPDSILLPTTVTNQHLEFIKHIDQYSSVFKVFDLEDLKTVVPDKNSRKSILFPNMERRLRDALSYCDRLIVTTEPIKQAHQDLIDDIQIVPIYLEKSRWGNVVSLRKQGLKPRVGWVGAPQHLGDLELIFDVVKATYKSVDWVFMGMCPEELKDYVAEAHGYVMFEDYSEKMASLDLDLAIAPLEIHPFNEAKSHLRLLEYGAMGWPVVCTDIYPYQNGPVKRVKNTKEAWVEAIMERVTDLDSTAKEGDELKKWVHDNWMLEDNLDVWMNALTPGDQVESLKQLHKKAI
jgi:O-antigen biosynthesis protein